MSAAQPSELLRPGLLEGVSLLLVGAARERRLSAAIAAACEGLGGSVRERELLGEGGSEELDGLLEDAALEAEIGELVDALGRIDVLVVDAAALFACARGEGARAALLGCLQASWAVVRAVANVAFLAREQPGRIVLVAPAPAAGPHADAAGAGLENLARTLSIEWARFQITPVTIAPAERTAAGLIGELVAYLASPAGAYFSGCLLDLRGPRPAGA